MNRLLPSSAALLALLLCSGPARAAAGDDERRQLLQQRQAIEARFKHDSLTCQQRFQVNACLDAARAERTASLKPIQARGEALDAQDRKARAEAQAQRVAERQQEFAAEEGRRRTEALQAAPAPVRGLAAEIPPGPHAPPVNPEAHARSVRKQADDAAHAAAREREQTSRRQRLVLEHRQDTQRRQEEREAAGRKPGKPLPIPSAAEIASAASAAASR